MNQRFVEVATEDGVGCAERSGLTLVIQELEIHLLTPPSWPAP
ncbi:Uncharacterised protein [Bordetella pertussis]|nr:Uncharacterised protein [Bordetella pertussis]